MIYAGAGVAWGALLVWVALPLVAPIVRWWARACAREDRVAVVVCPVDPSPVFGRWEVEDLALDHGLSLDDAYAFGECFERIRAADRGPSGFDIGAGLASDLARQVEEIRGLPEIMPWRRWCG